MQNSTQRGWIDLAMETNLGMQSGDLDMGAGRCRFSERRNGCAVDRHRCRAFDFYREQHR